MTQFSYHGETDHGPKCHCGRTATHHISYGSGCGNVCGIHCAAIQRRKRGVGIFSDDGDPIPPTVKSVTVVHGDYTVEAIQLTCQAPASRSRRSSHEPQPLPGDGAQFRVRKLGKVVAYTRDPDEVTRIIMEEA